MSDEIRFIGELQRVDVKPGDRFVIHTDQLLTPNMAEDLLRAWWRFVGKDGPPLMVLARGFRLGVLGESGDTNDTPTT